MEPSVIYYASPDSLDRVAWVCLNMPLEGLQCGFAFMALDPFRLIALFHGWLL